MDKSDQKCKKDSYCLKSVEIGLKSVGIRRKSVRESVDESEEESTVSSEGDVCSICLEEDIAIRTHFPTVCPHVFCYGCIFRVARTRKNSCPLCNRVYFRFDNQIISKAELDDFERILIGRGSQNQAVHLRKLLKSPKWKDLDKFWSRVYTTSIVFSREIVVVLMIDANTVPNAEQREQRIQQITESIKQAVAEGLLPPVIEILLKSRVNNILVMTVIVCARPRRSEKYTV